MESELEALNAKSALLVIAHPDDEAMFFAPFLLSAVASCSVHLLCLSSGERAVCGLALRVRRLTCVGWGLVHARVLDGLHGLRAARRKLRGTWGDPEARARHVRAILPAGRR